MPTLADDPDGYLATVAEMLVADDKADVVEILRSNARHPRRLRPRPRREEEDDDDENRTATEVVTKASGQWLRRNGMEAESESFGRPSRR